MKTVYVIGAGFSRDAYFPLQYEIIPRVYQLNEEIAGIPVKFIEKFFGDRTIPSLEDIFTLLDQAIIKRDNLCGLVHTELDDIRDKLIRAILYVFHSCSENLSNLSNNKFEPLIFPNDLKSYKTQIKEASSFYKTNAAYFVKERIINGLKSDTFSIICLNWDTLIEDSIYWCKSEIKKNRVDIDYCCYTSPLERDSTHVNSLVQKSKKIYNIKILKLHSSSNWLICPNCGRLFTNLGSKKDIWSLYMNEVECPRCKQYSRHITDKYPILLPFLITPTFLKRVDSNPHINMVWHNAFVELSEAEKIVFIGYSLPDSDYLIRTLLRRAINKPVEIEVVLTKNDIPPKNINKSFKNYFAAERYKSFFSQRVPVIYVDGVREYFKRLHGLNNFEKIINEVNSFHN